MVSNREIKCYNIDNIDAINYTKLKISLHYNPKQKMIIRVIAQKKSFILKFVTNCDGGHYKVWQLA